MSADHVKDLAVQNEPVATAGAPSAPTVSVIIATYNRSYTLRHAIQSVRDSSFTDWELLVVGDACTDDTAECVGAFADPRIRFFNLTARCGDQSGPNNHGVAMARGRYIAFLNHDDLYLPDHLGASVAELESSGADLVWGPCVLAYPKTDLSPGDKLCEFNITNLPIASEYSPFSFYFASCWVLRRGLVNGVGPWSKADRLFVEPSQDWLFRAWRSGAALQFRSAVSVIVVPAGRRPGCYARRESPEHEWLTRWLKVDSRSREHVLEEVAVNVAIQYLTYRVRYPALRIVARVLLRPVYAFVTWLGIHPLSLRNAVLHCGRRGGIVRHHRQRTCAV